MASALVDQSGELVALWTDQWGGSVVAHEDVTAWTDHHSPVRISRPPWSPWPHSCLNSRPGQSLSHSSCLRCSSSLDLCCVFLQFDPKKVLPVVRLYFQYTSLVLGHTYLVFFWNIGCGLRFLSVRSSDFITPGRCCFLHLAISGQGHLGSLALCVVLRVTSVQLRDPCVLFIMEIDEGVPLHEIEELWLVGEIQVCWWYAILYSVLLFISLLLPTSWLSLGWELRILLQYLGL